MFWTIAWILIAVIYLVAMYGFSISWHSHQAIGLLGFVVLIGFQLAAILASNLDHHEKIRAFYWDLARGRAKEDPWVDEYVESYRHLREHGNALAILALEFLLTLILVSAPSLQLATLALFFWILPSIYSWFIGALLESRLAKQQ